MPRQPLQRRPARAAVLALLLAACDDKPEATPEPRAEQQLTEQQLAEQKALDEAREQVLKVRDLVELHMLQKRGACPKTMDDLRASRVTNTIHVDPWGGAFEVVRCGTRDEIEVRSNGPDRRSGTDDDITSRPSG